MTPTPADWIACTTSNGGIEEWSWRTYSERLSHRWFKRKRGRNF